MVRVIVVGHRVRVEDVPGCLSGQPLPPRPFSAVFYPVEFAVLRSKPRTVWLPRVSAAADRLVRDGGVAKRHRVAQCRPPRDVISRDVIAAGQQQQQQRVRGGADQRAEWTFGACAQPRLCCSVYQYHVPSVL